MDVGWDVQAGEAFGLKLTAFVLLWDSGAASTTRVSASETFLFDGSVSYGFLLSDRKQKE